MEERGEQVNKTPTIEEAEAILTLVRGGWLRLEPTLDHAGSTGEVPPGCSR